MLTKLKETLKFWKIEVNYTKSL